MTPTLAIDAVALCVGLAQARAAKPGRAVVGVAADDRRAVIAAVEAEHQGAARAPAGPPRHLSTSGYRRLCRAVMKLPARAPILTGGISSSMGLPLTRG